MLWLNHLVQFISAIAGHSIGSQAGWVLVILDALATAGMGVGTLLAGLRSVLNYCTTKSLEERSSMIAACI